MARRIRKREVLSDYNGTRLIIAGFFGGFVMFAIMELLYPAIMSTPQRFDRLGGAVNLLFAYLVLGLIFGTVLQMMSRQKVD